MLEIELKQFFRQKKLVFLLFLLGALLLGQSLYFSYNHQVAKEEKVQYYQQFLSRFEHLGDEIEAAYQQELIDEASYQEEKEFIEGYLDTYKMELEAVEKEDWNYFYTKNIQNLFRDGVYISTNYDSYDIPSQTIENTVAVSRYLKEHQLPTAFPVDYFLTEFDQFETEADRELIYRLGKQALKGTSHQIWFSLKGWGILYLLPLFLLLFADFYTKDQTGLNRQRRFLKTVGLSPRTIISHKTLAFLGLFLFSYITVYTLHYSIIFLVNGASSWSYPITHYISNGIDTFVPHSQVELIIKPIYQAVLISFGLELLYLFLILGLAQLVTHVTKSPLSGCLLTLGFSLGGSWIQHPLNPFALWNAGAIADGSLLVHTNNQQFSFSHAYLVLSVASCLVYGLLYFSLTHDTREV